MQRVDFQVRVGVFNCQQILTRHVFNQSECRKYCLYIIIQKIAPQAKSGKHFPVADLGEGPLILGKKEEMTEG